MKKVLASLLVVMASAPVGVALRTAHADGRISALELDCDGSSNGDQVIDLVALIDQSGSLIKPSEKPLEELRKALAQSQGLFDNANSRLRLGVIRFSSDVEVIRSLSEGPVSANEFSKIRERLTSNIKGSTNYFTAMQAVLEEFNTNSAPENCRKLIWFTDGEASLGQSNKSQTASRVIDEFCSSDIAYSKLFRQSRIQPFVILLQAERSFPEQEPKDQDSDEYVKWVSLLGLRALTGDWTKGSQTVTPLNPERRICKTGKTGSEFADDFGEILETTELENFTFDLLRLIIRSTYAVDTDQCPSKSGLSGLPSGKFFERIAVAIKEPGSDLTVDPKVLNEFRNESLIILDRSNPDQASVLDQLADGWDLSLTNSGSELCFGYEFRSPEDLQFTASSEQDEWVYGQGGDTIDLQVDLGVFGPHVQSISSSDPRISEDKFTEGRRVVSFRPDATERSISELSSSIEVTPQSLGEAGRALTRKTPILGSLKLMSPISIRGFEDLPQISCGGSNTDLTLQLKQTTGEVEDKIYRSSSSCVLTNMNTDMSGQVRISISPDNPLTPLGGNNLGISLPGSDTPLSKGSVNVPRDGSDSTEFYLSFEEPFPNRQISYAETGEVFIDWVPSQGDPIALGRISATAQLNLKARSDKVLALIIALIVSIVALLLSYTLMYVVLRKTVSIANPQTTSYVTEREKLSRAMGLSGFTRTSPKPLDLGEMDVKIAKGEPGQTRKLEVGDLELAAGFPSWFHPVQALQGGWTEIRGQRGAPSRIGTSRPGRRAGTTTAPLAPISIAQVHSESEDGSTLDVTFTYIVPQNQARQLLATLQNLHETSFVTAVQDALSSQRATKSGAAKKTETNFQPDDQPVGAEQVNKEAPTDQPVRPSPNDNPRNPDTPTQQKPTQGFSERPPGAHPR